MITKLHNVMKILIVIAALSKKREYAVFVIIPALCTKWQIYFKVDYCSKNNISIYVQQFLNTHVFSF
jgi:hypothetical protein